jgi:hypothetical protein
MEEFRSIINYPNYSISNLGNVKNNKTNKILANSLHKSGYFIIGLFKDGKRWNFRINRLVAEAFLDGFDKQFYIDHIDRNKINNNIKNLRMVTPTQSVLNRGIWGKSKYKGTYFSKTRKDWRSQIRVNKKAISLGNFKTELEGAMAYNNYIEENHLLNYLKNII